MLSTMQGIKFRCWWKACVLWHHPTVLHSNTDPLLRSADCNSGRVAPDSDAPNAPITRHQSLLFSVQLFKCGRCTYRRCGCRQRCATGCCGELRGDSQADSRSVSLPLVYVTVINSFILLLDSLYGEGQVCLSVPLWWYPHPACDNVFPVCDSPCFSIQLKHRVSIFPPARRFHGLARGAGAARECGILALGYINFRGDKYFQLDRFQVFAVARKLVQPFVVQICVVQDEREPSLIHAVWMLWSGFPDVFQGGDQLRAGIIPS